MMLGRVMGIGMKRKKFSLDYFILVLEIYIFVIVFVSVYC